RVPLPVRSSGRWTVYWLLSRNGCCGDLSSRDVLVRICRAGWLANVRLMMTQSSRLANCSFDHADPLHHTAWLDKHQCKTEISINLLMNSFKAQRFLKANTPCFGRSDKAKISDEEHAIFVDCLVLYTLQFASQKWRKRKAEMDGQGCGTDNGAIVKLNVAWFIGGGNLPFLLQL